MELSEASQRLRDTREMSLYSVDLIHTTPLLSLKKSAIRFHFIGFTQLIVPSPMIQDRVRRSPGRTVGLLVREKLTRSWPLVSQLRPLTVGIFLFTEMRSCWRHVTCVSIHTPLNKYVWWYLRLTRIVLSSLWKTFIFLWVCVYCVWVVPLHSPTVKMKTW